jgi:hypothetical protein
MCVPTAINTLVGIAPGAGQLDHLSTDSGGYGGRVLAMGEALCESMRGCTKAGQLHYRALVLFSFTGALSSREQEAGQAGLPAHA